MCTCTLCLAIEPEDEVAHIEMMDHDESSGFDGSSDEATKSEDTQQPCDVSNINSMLQISTTCKIFKSQAYSKDQSRLPKQPLLHRYT